jgi:hypothetical protein
VESSLGSDVTRLIRLDVTTGKELEQIATDRAVTWAASW